MKDNKNIAIIILAAGMGTRMKSDKAKVLHEIDGKPMISYIVETAVKAVGNEVILVLGNQAGKVEDLVSKSHLVHFALQKEQLGTGHAVSCALPYLSERVEDVVIMCGDTPMVKNETIISLVNDHRKKDRDISLLAVELEKPDGYGRVVIDGDRVSGIVEESDADIQQKRIRIVNTGIYCIKKETLCEIIQKIKPDNAQSEIYLTDIIGIGHKEGRCVGMVVGNDPFEFSGVNTIEDLKALESIMMKRSGKIS